MNRKVLLGVFIALLAVACLMILGKTSAQTSSAASRITQAVDESRLTILRGNTHPFARPEFDQGVVAPNLAMNHLSLVLRRSPEQEAAVQQMLAAQQDKSSPFYHRPVTAKEFGQRFGASDADISTITSWLESHSLTVDEVAKGRELITFSGTASQISAAFHTDIHNYLINGKTYWANASDPAVPTALVSVVAGAAALHNFPRTPHSRFLGNFRRDKTTGEVRALKKEFTSGSPCGVVGGNCYLLGPGDFAAIYNSNQLYLTGCCGLGTVDGTGVAIAIVSQSDIHPSDFSNFRSLFGLSAGNLVITHDTGNPDPGVRESSGDEGESDLDTQWASAVARGATINLVVSDNVDHSAEYILNNADNLGIFNPKPAVLSESYGTCELQLGQAGNMMFSQLWSQAAADFITVVVSAGDQGSAGCDNPNTSQPDVTGLNVSGVSSTIANIAVGGTEFNQLNTQTTFWNANPTTDATGATQVTAKGYIPETTWNDSCTNLIWGQLGLSVNPETNCNNSSTSFAPALIPTGGAGGISNCTTANGVTAASCSGGNPKPAFQNNITPSDGHRYVPDVSLFASDGFLNSFYVVCEQDANSDQKNGATCNFQDANSGQTFQGFGGTSVSAQAFAGIMALVVEAHGAQNVALQNLYAIAAQNGASCTSAQNPSLSNCIFFDVTSGTIEQPCTLNEAANCSATTPMAVRASVVASPIVSDAILLSFLALCAGLLPFTIYARQRDWRRAVGFAMLAWALVTAACGGGGGNNPPPPQQVNGILTGYNAANGFDPATGLGSVNVTKLVGASQW